MTEKLMSILPGDGKSCGAEPRDAGFSERKGGEAPACNYKPHGAEQHLGEVLGWKIALYFTCFLPFPDNTRHVVDPLLERLADLSGKGFLVLKDLFGEYYSRRRWVLVEVLQMGTGELSDLPDSALGQLELLEELLEALLEVMDDGDEDLELAVEVPVDRLLGDADAIRDVLCRKSLYTTLFDELQGGFNDLFLPGFRIQPGQSNSSH